MQVFFLDGRCPRWLSYALCTPLATPILRCAILAAPLKQCSDVRAVTAHIRRAAGAARQKSVFFPLPQRLDSTHHSAHTYC